MTECLFSINSCNALFMRSLMIYCFGDTPNRCRKARCRLEGLMNPFSHTLPMSKDGSQKCASIYCRQVAKAVSSADSFSSRSIFSKMAYSVDLA